MRIGYVLGDLRTGRRSTFPALVREINKSDSIEPVIIYTNGNPERHFPTIESIKLGDYPLPPHWHRLERNHEFDVIHLSSIPKWGHLPSILADTPIVATDRGTAHWCPNTPSSSNRSDTWYKFEFRTRDYVGKFTLDKVFTVSDYVKETLVNRVGYNRDRLFTTYLGIDTEHYELDSVDVDLELPDHYLLHISNQSPIKNVGTLVDAFNKFVDDFPNYHLVIAGRGWESSLQQKCIKYGIEDKVTFLGYIDPIKKLISLYDGAKLYIQPSVHETFGRPIIEAMARGTPVLISKRCALNEVADESAILINDPSSGSEMANKMGNMISAPNLRSELRMKGLDRAEKFRFQNYASRLETGYESVI